MQADGKSLDDKRTDLLPPEKQGPKPTVKLTKDEHAKNNLPDILSRFSLREKSERIVTLAEVAEVNPRVSADLRPDALISFVPMAAVSAESASVISDETRVASNCMKGFTPFKRNDVLVAKITPCFENGKIVIANIEHDFGFGSTEFHVIRPKEGMRSAQMKSLSELDQLFASLQYRAFRGEL